MGKYREISHLLIPTLPTLSNKTSNERLLSEIIAYLNINIRELSEKSHTLRIRRITIAFLPIETEIQYQDSLESSVFANIQWAHSLNFVPNLTPSGQFRPLQLSSDSKPHCNQSLGQRNVEYVDVKSLVYTNQSEPCEALAAGSNSGGGDNAPFFMR